MEYRKRLVDRVLDQYLPHLTAVAIEGAKGVGKTATATQRAKTILNLSDPSVRHAVAGNWNLVAQVDPPVLVDEWQLEPSVWDRVKKAVDDDPAGGRFLLAGSAGADPHARIHSEAGRIISLHMRPLSLVERGIDTPTVSLEDLLSGDTPEIEGIASADLELYVDEILRSGFPGIRALPEVLREQQLDSYISRIVDKELPENGVTIRRPASLRAWMASYGAATSSTTSYTKILASATPGEGSRPSRSTMIGYRDELRRLFILDPVEPWIPTFAPLKRLAEQEKHHLVDPALAAQMVNIDKKGLLQGQGDVANPRTGTWLGALFESLATQSVKVYAQLHRAKVGHLRTHRGEREIDLIVESKNQKVLAIEVKLADTVHNDDVKHLNWLDDQIGDRLADKVVLYTGQYAYRRPDGVAVVPLSLLRP